MTLTVGSLFSGIGGLDLGLERAGMNVIWQSEIDPYASRVLAKHWPDIPNLGDVTTIDWSTVEPPDLICGGYPCQPFSYAGNRAGESDPRHLWPRMRDAIRHLRPRWVLLENVPGHLSLGFGSVLGDLADSGYDCEWDCIPAAAVGAPHLRYRIFVVAHLVDGSDVADSERVAGHVRRTELFRGRQDNPEQVGVGGSGSGSGGLDGGLGRRPGVVADADHVGSQGGGDTGSSEGLGEAGNESARSGATLDGGPVADSDGVGVELGTGLRESGPGRVGWGRPGDSSGTVPDSDSTGPQGQPVAGLDPPLGGPVRSGGERVTHPGGDAHWAVEPDVGRVAHGVPNRVDRLRCLGNAVVPQVAEFVGRRIMAVSEESV